MNCMRLFRGVKHKSLYKLCNAKFTGQHPLKFIETQNRLREKDGVSANFQLIYRAPMETAINASVAFVTFSASAIAAASIYYGLFAFDIDTLDSPVIVGSDVVIASNGAECLIYLTAFLLFQISLKILLSRYVVRIYQNGDNYLAIFRGHWYNSIKKHKFHLNEFKKLNPTFVVSWSDARYGLGNKHGIILENYFKTPEYFNYLLYKKKDQDLH